MLPWVVVTYHHGFYFPDHRLPHNDGHLLGCCTSVSVVIISSNSIAWVNNSPCLRTTRRFVSFIISMTTDRSFPSAYQACWNNERVGYFRRRYVCNMGWIREFHHNIDPVIRWHNSALCNMDHTHIITTANTLLHYGIHGVAIYCNNATLHINNAMMFQ